MAKKKAAKAAKPAKPPTKSEIMKTLAEQTGLTKKQVESVFDALTEMIAKNLGKKGPGVFAIPGLMKIKVVHKPAQPARKGINPFTGEETVFKAKPARNVVKVQALKKLKDMVQ